ncbi:hypothetical protein [Pediococcus stilesii]|uniref:hypothetical protein n=1 Tax=Pediococcus stilesii TaxID=331679 RepID=UPI000AE40290|nr:hypothetical protein [Pediococcus stilesii]
MFYLWYFSAVAWIMPSVLIGYGLHNGIIGWGIYIAAVIIQTWVSVISWQIKE